MILILVSSVVGSVIVAEHSVAGGNTLHKTVAVINLLASSYCVSEGKVTHSLYMFPFWKEETHLSCRSLSPSAVEGLMGRQAEPGSLPESHRTDQHNGGEQH